MASRWNMLFSRCTRSSSYKLRSQTWLTNHLFYKLVNPSSCRKFSGTIANQRQIMHDIPSPHQLPVVGTLFAVLLAGGPAKLHEYIDHRHKQLGGIFRERIGPIDSVFVCDAELIRQVFANEGKYPKHVLPDSWRLYNEMRGNHRGLYFMDGEEWLEYRKILNRILSKEDFKTKIERTDFLEGHVKTWLRNSRHNGEVTHLEEHLYVLSITFMIFHILGSPFIEHHHSFLPRIRQFATVVREIFECSVKLSTVPADLAKACNLKLWNRFVHAVDESMRISSDLLDRMCTFSDHDGILRDMLDANVPFEMIRRVVIDFIIAAGDTTATLTQWTLYLLGKHENIRERLHSELNSHRGEGEKLLKNILKETSRLYPVAPFIARYLPCQMEMSVPGGPTYLVEAGQLVSMSMYTSGRDERYFPEANTFKPDRWQRNCDSETADGSARYVAVNNVYASLPYAMGGRSCIGRKLAESQMLSTIRTIVLSYHLQSMNTVDIKLNLITVPSEPVKLRLLKRH